MTQIIAHPTMQLGRLTKFLGRTTKTLNRYDSFEPATHLDVD